MINKPYSVTRNIINTKDQLRIPSLAPFNVISPYRQYQIILEKNIQMLSQKFPQTQIQKLKKLLEQMQNDVQLVQSILQEEKQFSKIQKIPQKQVSQTQQQLKKQPQQEIKSKTQQIKPKNQQQTKQQHIQHQSYQMIKTKTLNSLLKRLVANITNKQLLIQQQINELERKIDQLKKEKKVCKLKKNLSQIPILINKFNNIELNQFSQ